LAEEYWTSKIKIKIIITSSSGGGGCDGRLKCNTHQLGLG